jgi:dienelactone hydrolase
MLIRLVALLLLASVSAARDLPAPTEALVIGPTGPSGRVVIVPDAIGKQIVDGSFAMPTDGEAVRLADGSSKAWKRIDIAEGGWLRAPELRGGYAAVSIPSEAGRTLMLDAQGHGMVFVNGEPRVGDPYSLGYVSIPIRLHKGDNVLLFKGGRGDIRVSFREPKADIEILTDHTLPDLTGPGTYWAGVLIANTTDRWVSPRLDVGLKGSSTTANAAAPMPPHSLQKVPVRFTVDQLPSEAAALHISILANDDAREPVAEAELPLAVRSGTDIRKITFKSEIDGSVQYYAIRPGSKPEPNQSLVLSLHGASVEATGQAGAYTAKDWAAIVCPTNRRPYGFDWEDWGRLDALEVLDHATKLLEPDPRRIYLTGHSMGGHGTWQLGAHFAPRFPVIAPSAGWVSFWSYTGAGEYKGADPVSDALRRAASPSDTLALKTNFTNSSIYMIHGEKDDNVPAEQSRKMREELLKFHDDFVYHEQPGAGHWWGNECVDWPKLWDFVRARPGMVPENVARIRFSTAAPSISSKAFWAEILQQAEPFRTSSIDIVADPALGIFNGSSVNVSTLALDLAFVKGDITLNLDGAQLKFPAGRVVLRRSSNSWSLAQEPPPSEKSPRRGGLFKDAFRNNVLLVAGTGGTPEENAAMLAKARYDSETFWYRGNATLPIVLDLDFVADAEPDRNVVVYGNADTNSAWRPLLEGSPLRVWNVEPGGNSTGALMIRPRPGSDTASVGVVAGSDLRGFRLAGRVPYFVSGVGIPDWLIVTPEAMDTGVAGIASAGFFDNQWNKPAVQQPEAAKPAAPAAE